MKYLLTLLACLFLSSSALSAAEFRDYDFQQDRMKTTSEAIFIISSFENEDRITAYRHNGLFCWEMPFGAKITSWEIRGDSIFVFSKARSGHKTFLTCLDTAYGYIKWERP